MLDRLRTYRPVSALLALALMLMGAAPLAQHLCRGDARVAAQEATHPCCKDRCPPRAPGTAGHEAPDAHHAPAPGSEPGGAEVCCDLAPATPTREVAVDAPAVAQFDAALPAAVLPAWLHAEGAPPPFPRDTGPPGSALRLHLAVSVLLI